MTDKIELIGPEACDRHDSLFLLYLPLAGQDACVLYEMLCALAAHEENTDLAHLTQLSGFSPLRLDKALVSLERCGLLSRWADPLKESRIFVLSAPLACSNFLRHAVYGRMLLNQAGSRRYDELRQLFACRDLKAEGYVCTSVSAVDTALESQWSDEKEEEFMRLQPRSDTSDFDWTVFYQGFEQQLPHRMRTAENEGLIAELARYYGLSEGDIRTYVIRACPPPLRQLDKESLIRQVERTTKSRTESADPYQMDPVSYLRSRQKGVAVSATDRKLIERLRQTYHFEPEMVNRLLDYVLRETNEQLPNGFVEKTAATWVRLGIDTPGKLESWKRDQKRSSHQPAKNQLPQWYADTGASGPTDDLLAEIEAMRAKDREDE